MVRRNSLRLEDHDYSSRGNYFITICTHQREYFFGLPDSNNPVEKALEKIITECWGDCLSDNITTPAFVIMPNHLHGIIRIKQPAIHIPTFHVGAIHESPLHERLELTNEQPMQKGSLEWIRARRQMKLSKIIGKFKMQSSKQINNFLEDNFGERPFKWQRNYYDHIIRAKNLRKE
ncbi:MAG TPA: transposase [Cytophagaceae bacterium]|jgi:putative transposase|nr:transposase [Cytophagaceae bacterium]